jgi:hypothetical protein
MKQKMDDKKVLNERESMEGNLAETAAQGAEPEMYRSQRAIDVAIGRRLRRERERWEKQHERALLLEEMLGEAGVEEALRAMEGGHVQEELADEAPAFDLDAALERAREEGRMEVMRSLRERGSRPLPLQARGAGAAVDFHSMSDAALRSIDARLKRGERVKV